MASFKQVTLKDPTTGDYLSPRVYGALEYEVVEDGEVTPPYDTNADTLQGHPASDFLLKSEYTPVDLSEYLKTATADTKYAAASHTHEIGNITGLDTKLSGYDTEIANLKSSVSEGKSLVAAAVTDKGVTTAADAAFQTIADNISQIKTETNLNFASGDGALYFNFFKGNYADEAELVRPTVLRNVPCTCIITESLVTDRSHASIEFRMRIYSLDANNNAPTQTGELFCPIMTNEPWTFTVTDNAFSVEMLDIYSEDYANGNGVVIPDLSGYMKYSDSVSVTDLDITQSTLTNGISLAFKTHPGVVPDFIKIESLSGAIEDNGDPYITIRQIVKGELIAKDGSTNIPRSSRDYAIETPSSYVSDGGLKLTGSGLAFYIGADEVNIRSGYTLTLNATLTLYVKE